MTDIKDILARLEAARPQTLVLNWLLDDARVILDERETLLFPRALFSEVEAWVKAQGSYTLDYSDIDPRGGMEGYFRYVRLG
jgi:hypothetical protein